MKIEFREIAIRELANGYEDNDEEGVFGYGGALDIRPPYQREFIYSGSQRDAVIDTASKGFPLNVMYWSVRDDGGFEVIDGQQRTISLCQFIEGDFSVQLGSFDEKRAFHNLQKDEQSRLLDYKLMVYLCSGSDSEKLEWFKTINIAGEELTDQELRNAVFHGPWVSDAKRYFSKSNCPAYGIGSRYLSGSVIRQDYLETAIKWHSEQGSIDGYMSERQTWEGAEELWEFFRGVIEWVEGLFPNYRKEMKGVQWGELYNQFKNESFDPKSLEQEVRTLMEDEEVTNKKGIFPYLLTGKENHLNIRSFNPKQKREAYERQNGVCPVCNERFEISQMEADHITPWHEGGKTIPNNCQMLCRDDNRRKSGR